MEEFSSATRQVALIASCRIFKRYTQGVLVYKKNAAIAMATILRNMKRFIGTKFGMSNKYIKTGLAFTLYGIGQGSGGGPAVWLCHLIVLFAILETTCSIPKFKSPNREKVHSSGGTGYVDDCTLMVQIKGKCRDAKIK